MHIISRKSLLKFSQIHAEASVPLDNWYRIAKTASWEHLGEVRQDFSSAEAVGNFTVFNIKGNDYRLIVGIDYEEQVIYIKYVLTHAEYNKEKWKNDPYY
ncbi:type II toxin-antitoxin system HigB family toxin [Chroococcidiopsis sp. CCMEE 29]|uniref:type II toxin-antitoxin system HigB family toxin n=1 Tax=Chroococcidiopsis sp. CCMEE 29 TaxID=155894 RepID=UPI0020201419|nr:type II toxin-antitoxin system HigB family toxin [Chroococcidiopsis sp. CCMEE 29]